ncbi:MAG: thioredoxin-dependent thiol peroxidase [Bacteroidales bacterium]|nr:thioredoxin-dependent thiol peroxidase [Bacteroidales bacterium]
MILEKGSKAPDFTFIDETGKEKNLSDLKGKKVVVYFYPKDNTPGCTAEACSFRDGYEELLKNGLYVIGISRDSEKSHASFRVKYHLPFPLVSDPEMKIIKAYGAYGKKKMAGKEYEGIIRMTFIIDENGYIEEVIDKVDTKNSAEQVLKILKKK